MAGAFFNDVFGRLTWDDNLGCWLGGIDWPPGLHTEVAIWVPAGDLLAGLRLAREGLEWLQEDEEGQACRCVAAEILEIYNDNWQDEEPITEDQLVRYLELVRIGFWEDGSLLLTYDAGDLFGGHLIEGEFGPDRTFRGAGLVG
jgi:hypothetical protein